MTVRLTRSLRLALLEVHNQREVTLGHFTWPGANTVGALARRGLVRVITMSTPTTSRPVLRLTQAGLQALGLPGIGADGVDEQRPLRICADCVCKGGPDAPWVQGGPTDACEAADHEELES